MKKKFFNKHLVISMFFFFLFIAAIVVDQMDVIENFKTTNVVMASQAIQKDTLVTEEMLYLKGVPNEDVNEAMITEMETVIGKTSTQLILPAQYVSNVALDASVLRPTADHEFFPIPDSWLIDIQGTIRRYDMVNISAVYAGDQDEEGRTPGIKTEHILKSVPVAYVKGNRNAEVTGTTSSNDRLYGTASPSSIELSLTLEEFKDLEKLNAEGYRFVISY